MKITCVSITNFKRIKDVRITPDADRTLILLGGKNKQGKSSTLDALTAAFGGKRVLPADPVRHGADEAAITVELDGGDLVISRVIQPDGESVLEVRDRLGAIKAPQAALDRLIGSRFLDPLAFQVLPAKDQRAQLMRMIEGADRIDDLDKKKERAFSKRTEVGRDLKSAEGELARLGPSIEVRKPINVAELTTEKAKFAEQQRAADGLGNVVAIAANRSKTAAERVKTVKSEIEALEDRLLDARTRLEGWEKESADLVAAEAEARANVETAALEWATTAARRAALDDQLAMADEHNRIVIEAEQKQKRRAETAATVEKLAAEVDAITKVLETIDARKADILNNAKLPVEGLSVDDEGITLDGVPFVQASDAEKWRVSLAIAIASSPGLDDVWIRDGALLDEETLALVAAQAAAAGKRPWIERVGTSDPDVIVIRDGQVVP